ncbi:hypothetical protein [Lysinibacillus cavernae]|nr:hypothetical protein [Lysinibacillus cavernae]
MSTFKDVVKERLVQGVSLPKTIAINEYKGDTNVGSLLIVY